MEDLDLEIPEQDKNKTMLVVDECLCGHPDCDSFVIAMLNPKIVQVRGTDKLTPAVKFSVGSAQQLVTRIRKVVAKKGVKIR